MDDKLIGPALPPHLINRLPSPTQSEESTNSKTDNEITDSESRSSPDQSSSDIPNDAVSQISECDSYGPALPPHLRKRPETMPSGTVGPSLPPELSHNLCNYPADNVSDDEEDPDAIVGPPVPSELGSSVLSLTQQKLEMRAQYLKRKMAEEGSGGKKRDVTERESWMLELPPERAVNLGLGQRSFRKREGPDMKDRSDWTDTPADRIRKQMLGQDSDCSKGNKDELMKAATICERDKVMEKMAESCKDQKRQLSLLEMHQKERSKKEKKEKKKRGDKPPERRPFDRDIDLQANRFDEAQKKSIFKKAQLLDTRFSSGQSKYL